MQKNMKGVFAKVTTGVKITVLINATIFAFRIFFANYKIKVLGGFDFILKHRNMIQNEKKWLKTSNCTCLEVVFWYLT